MPEEVSPEKQRLRELGTLLQQARICLEKIKADDVSHPWRKWCGERLAQAGEICTGFWPDRIFTSDLFTMAEESDEGDPVSLLERLTMRIAVIASVIRDMGEQGFTLEVGAPDDEVTVRRIN